MPRIGFTVGTSPPALLIQPSLSMAKPKTFIRYRLEYAGFLLLAGLIRALPLETASWLSGRGWRLFAPLIARHQRALNAIARAFPEKDSAWHRARVLEMWDNLGRVFAESFHLDAILSSDRVVLENEAEILATLAGKTRFIVAGVHLGNWEAGAAVAPRLGAQACGIYQRIHNPFIENYVRTMRAPLYPAGLFPKQSDAGRKVMRALQNGACLATMADLRDYYGPKVEFFGMPAPTNTFPALMARSFEVPLFAAMVVRTPLNGEHVRFAVRLVPMKVPHSEDRAADALAATTALHARFEEFIREYPGQWMWVHRRWG